MLRLALPCLLMLAGCTMSAEESARADAATARDEARLAKALVGFEAGKATSCYRPLGGSVSSETFGNAILYRESGRRLWLNRPSGGCFGLRRDDIIVTRSYGSGEHCRGDIIHTVDRTGGFPSGSCSFGDFVPYTKSRR